MTMAKAVLLQHDGPARQGRAMLVGPVASGQQPACVDDRSRLGGKADAARHDCRSGCCRAGSCSEVWQRRNPPSRPNVSGQVTPARHAHHGYQG